MADDSSSLPITDSTSSASATPSDQTTPPADIGQQPEGHWPNSTILANDQFSADSNLANRPVETGASAQAGDPQITPSAELVPESPNKEIPPQASSAEIDQVTPTTQDTTCLDSSVPSESEGTVPADSSSQSSPLLSSPDEPLSIPPSETLSLNVSQPESSEAAEPTEEKVETNVQLPDNSVPQVQSEVLNTAPTVDTGKPGESLANFKSEPPENPQEAPLANLSTETFISSHSPLFSTSSASSVSSVSSVPFSPSISFGELIKDLKPEESVIPPRVPSSHVSSSPSPQNLSSPSPTSDLSAEASAKADKLSFLRQKANQVRLQKKAKNLSKIMELAKNAKIISNTDVQRLLRVSQSTATNYLRELFQKGLLKRQGLRRGGVKYTLPVY